MLGNFLYYIIALLIYSTYQPSTDNQLPLPETLILFFGLAIFFAVFTRMQFRKIEALTGSAPPRDLDHLYQNVLTRQSILAILIYAIDIYALKISHLVRLIPLLQTIPTLEALIFLALFIFYLSIVWAVGYDAFAKIYRHGLSRKDYVRSNISFSIPVILPWLFLSLTADFINLLPFDAPKAFLVSTEGQILYFIFFLLLIAIIGPLLILKSWGCQSLGPGAFRQRIERLCQKANMRYRDIMIWPLFGGRMITAGVMGLIRRFRYILVTPALMRHLAPYEIDAVIAHEIGHIKKYHLLFYLIFFAGYLVVAFTTLDLLVYGVMYAETVYGLGSNSPFYASMSSISFSLMMIAVFLIYFRYVFGYFMRNFERQADLFAFRMFNDAQPLISTFEKITITSGQSPNRPNWHHFSIQERIDTLRACEANPSLVERHNAKIRKSIAVYAAAILLFGWIGYQAHNSSIQDSLSGRMLKSLVLEQLKTDARNPNLYQLLGDIYLNEKDYEKAISAYNQALEIDPDHVRTLNNLAWLLSTCDKKEFRNPEKSLQLASRAAELSTEPHVMDTLAEAYYVNGHYSEALKAGKKALLNATGDQAYYRKQVEKFKAAAENK